MGLNTVFERVIPIRIIISRNNLLFQHFDFKVTQKILGNQHVQWISLHKKEMPCYGKLQATFQNFGYHGSFWPSKIYFSHPTGEKKILGGPYFYQCFQ